MNKCFKCGELKPPMTSIAGCTYCSMCYAELTDKEAFFKKAREMAEGLTREQLIGYYMAELETCCEVEEKLIMAEKALDKIADLEAKLAEKEKEIENLNTRIFLSQLQSPEEQRLKIIGNSCCQYNPNQDKISFAIEKLKEMKKLFEEKYTYDIEESDFAVIYEDDVDEIINNQIKKIKGEE